MELDLLLGKEDDEERKLQDEDHAQEEILLIEVYEQDIYGIGIEACSGTIAVSEQAVEESADTTINGSKESNTPIAEINEERLEDGIHIRGDWYKDKLLQLVLDHDIGSKALQEEIDGLESVCSKLGNNFW